jgi:hypothetical protein
MAYHYFETVIAEKRMLPFLKFFTERVVFAGANELSEGGEQHCIFPSFVRIVHELIQVPPLSALQSGSKMAERLKIGKHS